MKPSLPSCIRSSALALAAAALSLSAAAQITLYEHNDFQGRTFNANNEVSSLLGSGYNDRASSVVVLRDRWEVCQNTEFGGRCRVLRPGIYPSLAVMGLNDRISSVRAVAVGQRIDDERYAPGSASSGTGIPTTPYDARRRANERLYQAQVLSTRAVVAAAEQRCWVEPGQVSQQRGRPSAGGGVVGALIGGVLGHQIGGGTGRDIATVAGVLGGAAVGARAGRERIDTSTPDVRRCENLPVNSQTQAEYWDVTYTFRGKEHHMQMTRPPGATVTVNSLGEPRV